MGTGSRYTHRAWTLAVSRRTDERPSDIGHTARLDEPADSVATLPEVIVGEEEARIAMVRDLVAVRSPPDDRVIAVIRSNSTTSASRTCPLPTHRPSRGSCGRKLRGPRDHLRRYPGGCHRPRRRPRRPQPRGQRHTAALPRAIRRSACPLTLKRNTWSTAYSNRSLPTCICRTISKRHLSTADTHPHQGKRRPPKRTSKIAHPSDTPLRSWHPAAGTGNRRQPAAPSGKSCRRRDLNPHALAGTRPLI